MASSPIPEPIPEPIPKIKARRNALKRHHGTDAQVTVDATRDLAAAVLEKHIRELVDKAPPLTEEQRTRLASLLGGA